jgi:hypothetical protein
MYTATPTRTFERRIGLLETCIILADVLNDEPVGGTDPSSLRRDASNDGLSFVWVSRTFHDGTYLARVAASAQAVRTAGFTVILSEEQLYSALPYDCTTSGKTHEEVRTLLRSHADTVRPLSKHDGELPPSQHREPNAPLTLVESVSIPEQELRESMQTACASTSIAGVDPFQMQQALLRVMLDTLMGQLHSGLETTQAQLVQARCHLIAVAQRLHRHTRQQLVHARARYDAQQGCMVWNLSLGMPLAALPA